MNDEGLKPGPKRCLAVQRRCKKILVAVTRRDGRVDEVAIGTAIRACMPRGLERERSTLIRRQNLVRITFGVTNEAAAPTSVVEMVVEAKIFVDDLVRAFSQTDHIVQTAEVLQNGLTYRLNI